MTLPETNPVTKVRVKICGITRPEDALTACRSGADAIGLVFYPGSPRCIELDSARLIKRVLSPFVSTVGLFVDAAADEVQLVIQEILPDFLQFHGDESPEFCRQFSRPYIKAVKMQANIDLNRIQSDYADASALLLDTYVKGKQGGTGQVFDWSLIPVKREKPIILAGGLDPENVRTAIEQVKPYAVDVSGGVESTTGIKDSAKIAGFIREVSNANK